MTWPRSRVSQALLAFVGASILAAAAFGLVLEVERAADALNSTTDYEIAFAVMGVVETVCLFGFYFLQRKLARGPRNVLRMKD